MNDRLRKSEWMVRECPIRDAAALVSAHHYAGGAPNTGVRIDGLFRLSDGALMGVAWWLPPTRAAALHFAPDAPNSVLALSRLVVAPGVPKNAASFLLMNSAKKLPARWTCLITYADTWRGHTGHIYRASGWDYRGLSKPSRVYLLNGRMVSRKMGPKTRSHLEMLALGAECPGAFAKHRFQYQRQLSGE